MTFFFRRDTRSQQGFLVTLALREETETHHVGSLLTLRPLSEAQLATRLTVAVPKADSAPGEPGAGYLFGCTFDHPCSLGAESAS